MTIELIFLSIFIFLAGLCWGSFLNVVAYRITFDKPFFTKRSHCPHCNHLIAWYDNIPLLSWLFLKGQCRSCKNQISFIYPLFELLSAIIILLLFFKLLPNFSPLSQLLSENPYGEFLAGAVFLSALLVSSIADLHAMVIPQLFTVWIVPLGVVFSYFNLTGISWQTSMLGAIFGYGILWLVAALFKALTKKDGLGVGDMELLCMIGAFLGPLGVWFTIMFGSILGMILGSFYLWLCGHGRMTRIPFGPFLALGAIAYFFLEQHIINLMLA